MTFAGIFAHFVGICLLRVESPKFSGRFAIDAKTAGEFSMKIPALFMRATSNHEKFISVGVLNIRGGRRCEPLLKTLVLPQASSRKLESR